MAKHYEYYIMTERGETHEDDIELMQYVHCGGFIGGADLLCGNMFDGSCQGNMYHVNMLNCRETEKKITCPECIKIIKSCKTIKASEIDKGIDK